MESFEKIKYVRFFTHEICVCAHLTQTRYAQRTCAEMGIKTENQVEIKIGHEI